MKTSIYSIAAFLVASSAAMAAADTAKSPACVAHEQKIVAAIDAAAKDKSKRIEDAMIDADSNCTVKGGGGGKLKVSLRTLDLHGTASGTSEEMPGAVVQLARYRSAQKSADGSSAAVSGWSARIVRAQTHDADLVRVEEGSFPVQLFEPRSLKGCGVKGHPGACR